MHPLKALLKLTWMVLYFVILGTPTFEDILRNDEGNWIYDFFGSRGKTSNL